MTILNIIKSLENLKYYSSMRLSTLRTTRVLVNTGSTKSEIGLIRAICYSAGVYFLGHRVKLSNEAAILTEAY